MKKAEEYYYEAAKNYNHNKNEGDWFKARLYSGVMDGSEFNDWYDDDYFQLNNITHFRQIQILI